MSRITLLAIGSVAAGAYACASNIAARRAANAFAAWRNLVTANLVEVLTVAGGTASASLTDISLAIAIAVVANVVRRINGTSPARTSLG
ncbi:hypothetical protein [Burkholderia dolosa]|uniref:hypothetical protein n=1 Tax=Burkholderia dolosa TaxID=152500 RepID=UPI001C956FA0|nr:hypothetical protein [Burkholderia dolosa]MBY4830564.1 hypothetical protein [Burkholderia dolosa]